MRIKLLSAGPASLFSMPDPLFSLTNPTKKDSPWLKVLHTTMVATFFLCAMVRERKSSVRAQILKRREKGKHRLPAHTREAEQRYQKRVARFCRMSTTSLATTKEVSTSLTQARDHNNQIPSSCRRWASGLKRKKRGRKKEGTDHRRVTGVAAAGIVAGHRREWGRTSTITAIATTKQTGAHLCG